MLQIIFSTILFCNVPSVQGWNGITPLHSVRADVERLLGPPSAPCKNHCKYETKTEVVFVGYSGEPCTNNDENRWRVPPDTVISVTVNLERTPKFSSLKLNPRKFTKTKDPELSGYTSYSSEELGVNYSVDNDGQVYSMHWFPTAKDEKALKCSESEPTYRLDLYGELKLRDEEFRLDNFAIELTGHSEATGYMLVYSGENVSESEAREHAKRAKGHLVRARNVNSERVVIRYGGKRKEFTTELYIVLKGAKTPNPSALRDQH